MYIKQLIKKIVRGYRCDSLHYLNYLARGGAEIGENVVLFSPETFSCDVHNLHLLKIGSNVQITEHVTVLTHDYSWSVIKGVTGEIIGNQNIVWIGNNVFIGIRTVILPGTIIEDNVIIGAGSVVKGKIDNNSVYAGVPAKKIMSLDEYRLKRIKSQKEEAVNIAIQYYKAHDKWPKPEILHEYFFLFGNTDNDNPVFNEKLKLVGNFEKSIQCYLNHKPEFESFEAFIDYAKESLGD